MHAQLLSQVHRQLLERSGTANIIAPYTPTPNEIVQAVLEFAHVGPGDVVYDVGCGDARLLCEAIQRGAERACGWDIDPQAISDAQARIDQQSLAAQVSVVCGDVLSTTIDWAAATVIILYLSVQGNLRIRPVLLEHTQPGARIVTVQFQLGDLPATDIRQVHHPGHHSDAAFFPLYLYTITPDLKRRHCSAPLAETSPTTATSRNTSE